ncbi:MAG: ATPase, T2SS/T4P/T4SS family [Agitococcus sp.]|nr:ATPase, T2SS/T4P/T4SS family [Agitococcus sp.]
MSEQVRTASSYLAQWGFPSNNLEPLVTHAQACASYAEYRVGDIVTALNLAIRDDIEKIMGDKPANVLTLEYLAGELPNLREQSLRILAISRGLPYLDVIDEGWVTAGNGLSASGRARLDTLNAAYILTADGTPMVVFSDLNNLLSFSHIGRRDREQDPVRLSITKEPLVGLAPPPVVARAARGDGTMEPAMMVSTAAQDNFWSPSLAKTEAERIFGRLADEALNRKATDIALTPLRDGTMLVQLRVLGDLTSPERYSLLAPDITKEITNFLISRSRAGDGGRLRKPADGQITYKNSSFESQIRCSFIPTARHGLDFDMISASLRFFAKTTRRIDLETLQLPPLLIKEVRQTLIRTQGLILLAGPTGSGKSTTIAGVVGEHIKMFALTKKRISLEEPVERYLDDIVQVEVDHNFAELMRALLRHDPDLVWVGEIRDPFSAGACVRAATSGHIVVATVHANDSILAFRAVANYLRSQSSEESGSGATLFDLAESLTLSIGQRLIKQLCKCSIKTKVTDADVESLKQYYVAEAQEPLIEKAMAVLANGVHVPKKGGCKLCHGTGFQGEIPIVEMLPATRAVKNIYSQSESGLDYSALSLHRKLTLAESALALVSTGQAEFSALFI